MGSEVEQRRQSLTVRDRSGVRVCSSYSQWMGEQRLYWEQDSYLCPYLMHNGQRHPLLLWSILAILFLCLDLRADSDYKTCDITFSPTFCFLEYACRVRCTWMLVGTICAWFWIWMGRKIISMKDLGMQQSRRNGCMLVNKWGSNWISMVYGLWSKDV